MTMLNAPALTSWYDTHKRDLPWRHTTDPYRIWLSEIILQQTRVDQGMKYYHAFVDRFPDVLALAAADEQLVLRTWQGLGYYSRARNLHAAAQHIAENLNGTFPNTYPDIIQLKGVGPYTAAAIASFAFGEATPVVDGNVQRVISRFRALDIEVDTRAGHQAILDVLTPAIGTVDPATFNQAIMELGATVCTPKKPACATCPLHVNCTAGPAGTWAEFPKKKGKTNVVDRWLDCFLFASETHVLLRKRDTSGIWKNMYDFPTAEFDAAPTLEATQTAFAELFPAMNGNQLAALTKTKHVLSHRRLHVTLYRVHTSEPAAAQGDDLHWIARTRLDDYPLPRLVERLLENWHSEPGLFG